MLDRFKNNALFRTWDKIPFLRRSGTASLGDLAKALGITLALIFLVNTPTYIAHPLYLLFTLAVLIPLVGLILLAHPFLSHRATLAESFGFKKRHK
jgi:hypothetical protein